MLWLNSHISLKVDHVGVDFFKKDIEEQTPLGVTSSEFNLIPFVNTSPASVVNR